MITNEQKKNYLENVLLNGDLLEQPFSLFIDIVKDVVHRDKYGYSLNKNLLKFTNIETERQVKIPKHYIPILLDLIKIAYNITVDRHTSSNKISLYQNTLRSDYEILKFMEKEKEEQELKDKDKNTSRTRSFDKYKNYDILYIDNNRDIVHEIKLTYDLYKLVKLLGVRHTAYYFYFLYELEEYA